MAGMFCTTFALIYEHSQSAKKLEDELEEVHLGWGSWMAVHAQKRMARVTLDSGDKLELGHKLQLCDSLKNLIANERQINNYNGSVDATRSIKMASEILDMLDVKSIEDFKRQAAEAYGEAYADDPLYQWKFGMERFPSGGDNFLSKAIEFQRTPQ